MARIAAMLLIALLVLAGSLNAAAQGLLGEKYLSITFDEYWTGDNTPEHGLTAGLNAPLTSSVDMSVNAGRIGFGGSSDDALIAALGFTTHGNTERTLVPYVGVSGGAAIVRDNSAYTAALDAGAQVALSSRIAFTPWLGLGVSWADGADTMTVFSFGLSADVYVTEKLIVLVGGGLDYSPDLPSHAATSEAASIGLAFLP